MTMIPADDEETVVCGQLSPLTVQVFEPVGRWFEAHHRRTHGHHGVSHSSLDGAASSSESEEEEEEEDQFDEEDESMIMSLDPKNVKKQDHYQVLGLSKLRYRASEDQVKRAYKMKVLNHHPDKRKARGKKVKDGDDDYFTCITKAYEILGSKEKRRSFDSVDPEFDDSVPKTDSVTKDNFYDTFRPAFERNARWSLKKRVPKLGDDNSSFDDVNHFYSFWYEFNSWREFSYLDEEEKDKGENRDERRWIDRQNKAARQKLKKDEVIRLRSLVDNAYSCDPRVLKFKEKEKERKNAIKQAKADAARKKAEEEERRKQEAIEEEKRKKEEEEAALKAKNASIKKEREAMKKKLKKQRTAFRSYMEGFEYFANSNEDTRIKNLGEMDRLAEILSLTSLQSLNEELGKGDKGAAETAFFDKIKEVNDSLEKEKREQLKMTQGKSSGDGGGAKKLWSEPETQHLIKGVNLFPAGTQDRWEVIANFMKQHIPDCTKNAKDVLNKAKELQKNDMERREEAKKNAFAKYEEGFKTKKSCEMDDPSKRVESVGEQQVREMGHNSAAWTPEEQKLLEQALKSYPASDKERWDKIASAVSSRSKKDCMKRYKELCELVKAKKQAQTAVAAGKAKKPS